MIDDHVENIIEKLNLCQLMHLFKEIYSFQPRLRKQRLLHFFLYFLMF